MRVKWALARFSALCAPEERLEAELALAPEMTMPADLKARTGAQDAKGVWEGQISQFESRVISLEGQRKVIREKIAQLEHQIRGTEAVLKAYEAQLASVRREPGSYKPLVDRGLATLARYSRTERQGQQIEGQIAEGAAVVNSRRKGCVGANLDLRFVNRRRQIRS